MSITGTSVLENARIVCNDVAAETWDNDDALKFLNEGIRFILSQHPESRLKDDGTLRSYSAMSAVTDTISLDDEYLLPITEYYLHRYFLSDSGDARDKERSQAHYGKFLEFFAPV